MLDEHRPAFAWYGGNSFDTIADTGFVVAALVAAGAAAAAVVVALMVDP